MYFRESRLARLFARRTAMKEGVNRSPGAEFQSWAKESLPSGQQGAGDSMPLLEVRTSHLHNVVRQLGPTLSGE